MEAGDASNDTVHPEVRAHVNSLVSALGGFSADDDGLYKLGDDALECLRDLKRWIRFYDEKTNRMDVARCLAEANLVGGDLLHILALWPENSTDSKYKARIALACLEVMVPLTWPIEKDPERMTVNHHRHLPVLQLAQVGYKKAIINFDGAQILHTAVRVALPSLAIPIGDRTARDQGIIKLVLFFLRNIAMISPPPGAQNETEESLISRSATIDAFSFQDIFLTLLAIASNMGEDFRTEDVTVMEILFHLVKRVDPGRLFLEEQELHKAKGDELAAMMNKEAAMLKSYKKTAPTRHNRFGSMIWVTRGNGKMSTITGQDALLNAATRALKMDSKPFRPPKRAPKEDMEPKDLGPPVSLNSRANKQLRSFVEEFLDSGFNPLFQHVRKSIDREASHVQGYHKGQFFYLVAWFLEAERKRRKSKKGPSVPHAVDEVGSFNLVAGVLNQEMFITLSRALDRSYNEKDWQELTTVMRCFTQILLTVQEMSESGNEEDEEIADNILNRLFYEESTHDAVANIVGKYKDQGFEYLDACTELTHTYLRILETYSKQNVDMQVRSRKRARRKRKTKANTKTASEDVGADDGNPDDMDNESANDEARAEQTGRERKFDFKRFSMRFVPQGVVDTFVKFTRYYRDLNDGQLKRAHRYFHRVAFKQEMSVMLFRVDIIHLFFNMVKGPEPLDKSSGMFKEWEELGRQIIKKCVRKLEERPALIIELLFSKINSTAHYLEFGYEKQTISTNPRPAAELEFRRDVERDQQIAIAVGVLLDKSQADHIAWIRKQLAGAESERRAWEAAEKAKPSVEAQDGEAPSDEAGETSASGTAPPITVQPDTDARRTAMFKNPHLRLLMKLVGIERLAPLLDETPESIWVVPSGLTADQLKESLDLVGKAEFSPPVFEDGELAADQLRRKSAARKRANYDDDDGVADLIDDGDDMLFAPGGPTSRQPDAKKKKATRGRRQRDGSAEADAEAVTDEQLEERRQARRRRELEKARKIKSDVYVHASDDETDDERDREFFLRERLRQEAKDGTFGLSSKPVATTDPEERTTWDVLVGDGIDVSDAEAPARASRVRTNKRKSTAALVASSDDYDSGDGSDHGGGEPRQTKKRRTRPALTARVLVESGDEDEAMDSAQSSSHIENDADGDDNADDGEENNPDMMDTDDTPLSSSASAHVVNQVDGAADAPMDGRGVDDGDEEQVVTVTKARSRARAGFIVDSSDEE